MDLKAKKQRVEGGKPDFIRKGRYQTVQGAEVLMGIAKLRTEKHSVDAARLTRKLEEAKRQKIEDPEAELAAKLIFQGQKIEDLEAEIQAKVDMAEEAGEIAWDLKYYLYNSHGYRRTFAAVQELRDHLKKEIDEAKEEEDEAQEALWKTEEDKEEADKAAFEARVASLRGGGGQDEAHKAAVEARVAILRTKEAEEEEEEEEAAKAAPP
jgi:hypothetical protein